MGLISRVSSRTYRLPKCVYKKNQMAHPQKDVIHLFILNKKSPHPRFFLVDQSETTLKPSIDSIEQTPDNLNLSISDLISKYRSHPVPIFTNVSKKPVKKNSGVKKCKKTGPYSVLLQDVAYLLENKEGKGLEMNFYDVDENRNELTMGELQVIYGYNPNSNQYPLLKNPEIHPETSKPKIMPTTELKKIFTKTYYDSDPTYKVYKHFRELNYFIGSGSKYGMHFLIYAIEPSLCHATFTVYVWDVKKRNGRQPRQVEINRMCRSAIAVHKVHLLAVVFEDGRMEFTRLEWHGRSKKLRSKKIDK